VVRLGIPRRKTDRVPRCDVTEYSVIDVFARGSDGVCGRSHIIKVGLAGNPLAGRLLSVRARREPRPTGSLYKARTINSCETACGGRLPLNRLAGASSAEDLPRRCPPRHRAPSFSPLAKTLVCVSSTSGNVWFSADSLAN